MGRSAPNIGRVKLVVAAAALLLWMGFIFHMSAKTGGASGGMSESVAAWLAQLFCPDWAKMPQDARAVLLSRMSLPVRKGAHIAEYAILAALAYATFSQARAMLPRRAGENGSVGDAGGKRRGAAERSAPAGVGEGVHAGRAFPFTALTAFAFSALYAASDEFHQLFVPGRAGLLSDVGIDSCGAAVGAALAALAAYARFKKGKGRDVS